MTERTSRLTIFAFLWACQALVHHEYYQQWLYLNDWAGYLVAILAVAVLLKPSSLPLFASMLVASVVYNVQLWPFVKNHILVESLLDLTMLAALAVAFAKERVNGQLDYDARERLFDRFAPVLRAMVIVMYYFAFIAKLNSDFVNPQVSCVAAMYGDLLQRLAFITNADWAKETAIWATLVIEGAIPVLFTFRRTRLLAVVIGLPFHLMLGSIGHRTFSALAYGVYALFVMDGLASLVNDWGAWAERRFGRARLDRWRTVASAAVVAGVTGLIAVAKAGYYHAALGPFAAHRVAWIVWGLWSLAVGAAYLLAIWRIAHDPRSERATAEIAPVRWVHVMTLVAVLNGMSQYLGFKTETCFTMYSNLRTEAGVSNHLFLPPWRLANYQDDLVDVLETDHPELQEYVNRHDLITYFEFRRLTSTTDHDFRVRYRRNGEPERVFERRDGVGSDAELMSPQPLVAAKLLYFRPVSKEVLAPCRH